MLQSNQKEEIEKELTYQFSRSGGSGGQHVNKTSTKVTLNFDINQCRVLTQKQKEKVFTKLANKVNVEGVLQLSSEEERSQLRNKKLVTERFFGLLEFALKKKKKRKKTKPSKGAKERRLKKKKEHSQKKKRRRGDDLPGLT